MAETQDISKIIGIIMENPDIIARIKSLADGGSENKESDTQDTNIPTAEKTESAVAESSEAVSAASVTYTKTQSKKRRRELLCALKPYVKSERAKAIDTMLSVIDVIDVMKER